MKHLATLILILMIVAAAGHGEEIPMIEWSGKGEDTPILSASILHPDSEFDESLIEKTAYPYVDGVYEGSGEGIGKIDVKIIVKGGRVEDVEIVNQSETSTIGGVALPECVQQTIEKQSTDIDGIAGATITSNGYREAVRDALSKAIIKTPIPTSIPAFDDNRDGIYAGSGKGMGKIDVMVIVKDGRIEDVEFVALSETPTIGGVALPECVRQTIEKQSADIDGIAGATITSNGYREAVRDALSKVLD